MAKKIGTIRIKIINILKKNINMEKFKKFSLLPNKKGVNRIVGKEKKNYIERETKSLISIFNDFNRDSTELLFYLNNYYKNKLIRLKNNEKVSKEFKLLKVRFIMEIIDNINNITICFYETETYYHQLISDTEITILTEKRDYNPDDPFDEEDWEQ